MRRGRGRAGTRERRVEVRSQLPRMLVVCEGAKTEPNYFKAFPLASLTIKIVGLGDNTLSLVRQAIRLAAEDDYDQVWCVFDKDSFPDQSFDGAIELARNNWFMCAWSNECFEIWYILHFCYMDAAVSRSTYEERLSRFLGEKYRKNDPEMYEKLLPKQPEALRNASALRESYNESQQPARRNPCTTVDQLVAELNKHSTR